MIFSPLEQFEIVPLFSFTNSSFFLFLVFFFILAFFYLTLFRSIVQKKMRLIRKIYMIVFLILIFKNVDLLPICQCMPNGGVALHDLNAEFNLSYEEMASVLDFARIFAKQGHLMSNNQLAEVELSEDIGQIASQNHAGDMTLEEIQRYNDTIISIHTIMKSMNFNVVVDDDQLEYLQPMENRIKLCIRPFCDTLL